MTLKLEPSDLVTTEFQSVPLAEVLSKPVTALLGVTTDAAAALADIGVETVFDLALSRVFAAAVELVRAATDPGSAFSRFGAPPSDLLADDAPDLTAVGDLRFERSTSSPASPTRRASRLRWPSRRYVTSRSTRRSGQPRTPSGGLLPRPG